jgi:heme/copper-type cytochrome/quinol oxidase subunit 3
MAVPATTSNASTAGLPAPGRAGTPALVGTICALIAGTMVTGGVCSAYIAVRNDSNTFNGNVTAFISNMNFNQYAAFMTTMTMLLASIAAGWASMSMKIQNRRWASTGFGVAAFLDLAALNMVWFAAQTAKMPARGGAVYGILFYAMIFVAVAMIAIGLLSSLMGLARVLGAQATSRQPHYAMHALWLQHLAGAAWFAIYATIYWLK